LPNVSRTLQPATKKSRHETAVSHIPTSLSISSTISTTQQFYSGPNGGMVAVMPKAGFTHHPAPILQK
jgi:hypothetical protein